ncbi:MULTISPECIES: endonuclease/exonuclease/phosphatase family protein [Clostridium]|uniref:Endonuclease/exonuclease/phosphatase family protein n=2 Tax=Clostridium beijerinckii TaxID=1520 RepID=A0AB74VMQ0_CLOBE|nr:MULTISPECIES: endonuclease/exonuclease/phosphatase family protein [Clostridium]MBC2459356.1 endonuclease/exonuclease/phosphatase family protein [Clostridium beijerinckii]MBC2476837.1 endonuclease/exonuclease/phosphatase family protein [Clostridium beijerinckii]MDG5854641.1 endonuclease/exonuclease/phosphatase family protein [Clostridium beijerinckii]NOV59890.1 endonuclease/exonuclease/phosphatase family metal-dependent hydrolase [Clostridium beijerinckii]NOV71327.1 endonuclease/exonuclease/
MRVMTFNLRRDVPIDFNDRWNTRRSLIYNVINEYKCDIIGAQEIKDNMLNDIKENIEGYNIIGAPRGKKVSSERNSLLISRNYLIEDYKTFWLSETPDKIGSRVWYSYLPRICTTAILQMDNGRRVRVCNTHLDNLLPKARMYGLKKILEFIENEKLPVILMGDFNDRPNSKLIKSLKEGKISSKKLLPVQDVNMGLYNESTIGNFKRSGKGLHIDYIFVSEEIDVVNAEIIKYNVNGKYPSDHYPLMADIVIN